MIEVWKPVVGFEGFYEVSDQGRVKSLRSGKPLVPDMVKGYLRVTLSGIGTQKSRLVHHLVLEAFVGPRPDGTECCHGKGGKNDNSLINLRWDTRAENVADRYRHRGHIPPKTWKTLEALADQRALRKSLAYE